MGGAVADGEAADALGLIRSRAAHDADARQRLVTGPVPPDQETDAQDALSAARERIAAAPDRDCP
ncbi:hypothetical protein BIV23_23645 [Streptomyces monashensis]|uniref:Uncharacterized protein n=1 Tax=Streptomyces monashensis TaxID=1678012 RepID=A0A1S2QBT8_9ACTN|nr:hypothetical protein BIV23_23645 [Streptomyces monashensis]